MSDFREKAMSCDSPLILIMFLAIKMASINDGCLEKNLQCKRITIVDDLLLPHYTESSGNGVKGSFIIEIGHT